MFFILIYVIFASFITSSKIEIHPIEQSRLNEKFESFHYTSFSHINHNEFDKDSNFSFHYNEF